MVETSCSCLAHDGCKLFTVNMFNLVDNKHMYTKVMCKTIFSGVYIHIVQTL